uniref:Uncharacterized protein n=1 Tax=Anguilla anguilla TaxID=7936 RepID=A0A0E9PDD8_ANGAN
MCSNSSNCERKAQILVSTSKTRVCYGLC